ncbi:hypothetical protein LshimejAT787_1701080 [Lyophyllum shimeji]|uniref:Uncharacterized protein n=1 Tax=Lyophyllum shimeji TaxID=47721 RepID=A0A9P3PZH6_LYOSH|nr:hypothetical protein LshimejAT787_1701080 [Lyophyllum shimeji]
MMQQIPISGFLQDTDASGSGVRIARKITALQDSDKQRMERGTTGTWLRKSGSTDVSQPLFFLHSSTGRLLSHPGSSNCVARPANYLPFALTPQTGQSSLAVTSPNAQQSNYFRAQQSASSRIERATTGAFEMPSVSSKRSLKPVHDGIFVLWQRGDKPDYRWL